MFIFSSKNGFLRIEPRRWNVFHLPSLQKTSNQREIGLAKISFAAIINEGSFFRAIEFAPPFQFVAFVCVSFYIHLAWQTCTGTPAEIVAVHSQKLN